MLGCMLVAWLAAASPDGLAKARAYVTEQLRYADGIQLLEELLADSALSVTDQIEAYRLLGIALVAKGAPESAEAAFVELLRRAPRFSLDPRLSPKIHEAFVAAKKRAPKAVQILEVRATPEARRARFEAKLDDPSGSVSQVVLQTRFGEEPSWSSVIMDRRGDDLEAIVELPDLARLRIDYFLEAKSGEEVVANAGDRDHPSSVLVDRAPPPAPVQAPVAIEEGPPWYGHWWVWAIGAVVVAGTVTGVVLATQADADPDGTLPPITLP